MQNCICASLITLGILLPDLYLGYFSKMLTCTIPYTTLLGVLGFASVLSFVRNRWVLGLIAGLIALTQTIQLNHWAYFGAPIHSHDITKVFFELDEIFQTGASLVHVLWPVWIVLGASIALIIVGLQITKHRKYYSYAWVPVVISLAITPVLSHLKGPSFFYTKPTYSTIYNTVRAFSDWIVHSQAKVKDLGYKPYSITYGTPKVRNVILIMGESLSSRYMHLYGYNQPNTPFLDSLKTTKNFVYAKGVSSGVSTRSCLQLFFNTVHNPGFRELIRKKEANLFHLAQQQGYKTVILSAQNEKLFHDTGTEFVKEFASEKDMRESLNKKGDEALLDALATLKLSDKNFIVIHLRHIHSPFGGYAKYHPELVASKKHKKRTSQTQQEYSDAIAYHDYWVKQCIATVKKILPTDTVIVFTSDHGQLVGERGMFGHNLMQPEVADVPVWAYVLGTNAALVAPIKNQPFSHYDVGKLIATFFGAEITNPNEDPSLQFVHGSEIYTNYEFMPWKKASGAPAFLKNRRVGE
jgi:glucan phosphoethanolaminetransferase (alkaline phosphatase superfamily)